VTIHASELVEFASEAAFVIDVGARIVAWNDPAQRLLGYSSSEVIGSYCGDVLQATLPCGEPLCHYDCDIEYAVKGERTIVLGQGIEYWYLPVDFSAPKLEEYLQFKDKLGQVGDKKLLIHCAANYRVSAFYSRYAIESAIWSVEEANSFMLSIWDPDAYPGWPEWLMEVEQAFPGPKDI